MSKLGPTSIWEFGNVHNGKTIESLPRDYLRWVVKNFRKGAARDACRRQLEMLEFPVTEHEIADKFVQGKYDARHLYDANAKTDLEEWDGFNPPFDATVKRETHVSEPTRELFVGIS